LSDLYQLLPPYPTEWYTVAFPKNLNPGDLRTFKFIGKEVVFYRTRSGAAGLMGVYCPHLGAHIGFGGRVVGDPVGKYRQWAKQFYCERTAINPNGFMKIPSKQNPA
jgi:hypothetical protein